MNQPMNKNIFLRLIVSGAVGAVMLAAVIKPFSTLAQTAFTWAEPDCDPAVNPADCNVSAPLNVSDSAQTKDGALTIDDTLNVAGALTGGSTLSISGATSLGTLTVNSTSTFTGLATFGSSTSSIGGMSVYNQFTYFGPAASFTVSANSIGDAEVSNTLTASKFIGSGSTTEAIDFGTAEFYTNGETWVKTTGDTMTGTLTLTPASSMQALKINQYFDVDGLNINSESDTNALRVSVAGTATGNGLYVSTAGSGSGLSVVSSTTSSTAYPIDVQSNGSAMQAISVTTNTPSGYGIVANASSASCTACTAIRGNGTSVGVYGYASTTGTGVRGDSASGYGGYFTSAGDHVVDIASTTNATDGLNISTKGVGLNITTNTSTADATGIYVTTTGGQDGIVVNSDNTGIDLTVSDYSTAVEANNGIVHSTGGYRGGQFYANEASGSSLYADVEPYFLNTTSIPSTVFSDQLLFDGGSIWVSSYPNTATYSNIRRLSAVDGHQVLSDTNTASDNGVMVLVDDTIFVFYQSGAYYTIDRYDGTIGSGTLSIAINPTAAVFDGESIWLGTSNAIYEWTSPASTTIHLRATGLGTINNLIYADGYVWASNSANDRVIQMDPSTYTTTNITVGDEPVDIVYDGQYIWAANHTDSSLTRINTEDSSTSTVSVSDLGTGPNTLAFDGQQIWMGFDSFGVGYYNVATNAVGKQNSLDGASINDMVFDGTYLWALGSGAGVPNYIFQIPTGTGHGNSTPSITDGMLMYNSAGTVYCVYINAGTVTASTTLTNCQ